MTTDGGDTTGIDVEQLVAGVLPTVEEMLDGVLVKIRSMLIC